MEYTLWRLVGIGCTMGHNDILTRSCWTLDCRSSTISITASRKLVEVDWYITKKRILTALSLFSKHSPKLLRFSGWKQTVINRIDRMFFIINHQESPQIPHDNYKLYHSPLFLIDNLSNQLDQLIITIPYFEKRKGDKIYEAHVQVTCNMIHLWKPILEKILGPDSQTILSLNFPHNMMFL